MQSLPDRPAIHGGHSRAPLVPAERRASHVFRTVFLVTAMTLYFLSIARLPLTTTASTFFVGPIMAAVLSVIVLKERLTSRKALSLTLGFVGSIVILRPGGSMDPGILLALGSGIFFAFYLIATRHAAQDSDPVKTLAFQCVLGMVLLTPKPRCPGRHPRRTICSSSPAWACFAISHLLSIAAFRLADASTLAPLVYLELIGAALVGYVAFSEVPGVPTIVGAGLIIVAGLILLRPQDGSSIVD